MASDLTGENVLHGTIQRSLTDIREKSFYLHRHLEKIHSDFQKVIQSNMYNNVLLIMNTPGSLKNFMVHTDPDVFQEIFISLLTRALLQTEKGCLEFGYILSWRDQFHFYVKDGAGYFRRDQYDPRVYFESGPQLTGLETTVGLVEMLEGRLWVELLPGRGTAWWFTLDLQPSNSRNYPYKELPDSGSLPDWTGKTILVVEDTCNNYLLLETILRPTGVNLISVENGIKAVNTVKKNKNIDLVLMDLSLPVLDGYEASRRIKSFSPWIPVVAVSAFAVGKEIDRCISAGCDSFLGKPLNTSELIRTISELFIKFHSDRL
jgi:CheY-like chemotaxis protein